MLSIVPPGEAGATAAAIAAAAGRTGARPLVADWNAVSPATVRELEQALADGGSRARRRLDLRRPAACRLPHARLSLRAGLRPSSPLRRRPGSMPATVGDTVGLASAVKMCTASMYKGSSALLAHALLTAQAHGVLPQVLDDLGDSFPRQIDRAARMLAVSATKADRYVGEMREIAATQAGGGSHARPLRGDGRGVRGGRAQLVAAEAPEAIPSEPDLEDVLDGISPR